MGKSREKKYINSIVAYKKNKSLKNINDNNKPKDKSDSDQKNDTNNQQIKSNKENDKINDVNNKENIQDVKKNETALNENKNSDENDKTNDANNKDMQSAEKNEIMLINENKNADGNDDDDDYENVTEINFKKSMKKLIRKKSISQYNIKNIITYILNEYTGCGLFDFFLNILSLNKVKPVWHLASMMYNLYLNPTKSFASGILLFFSLSEI